MGVACWLLVGVSCASTLLEDGATGAKLNSNTKAKVKTPHLIIDRVRFFRELWLRVLVRTLGVSNSVDRYPDTNVYSTSTVINWPSETGIGASSNFSLKMVTGGMAPGVPE